VVEKGVASFWLRINDKNTEDTWVVDRRGYTKPTSWASQTYFNWDESIPNGPVENSAVIVGSGLWNRNDKFAVSPFVCEGDFVEIEPKPAKNRNLNRNVYNNGEVDEDEPLLKCWTCEANSYSDCETRGTLETCQPNEKSCELEVRLKWGYANRVITGCKATDACQNNKEQNFKETQFSWTQCRPERQFRFGVCRQCCDTDSCANQGQMWRPRTREDWAKDFS